MTGTGFPIDRTLTRLSRSRRIAGLVTDTVGVLILAGKVLVRHWPVLLALALAGEIAREGLVILTADVAYHHGPVGYLVFALVPVSFLIAMVLMLRVARTSLPRLQTTGSPKGHLVTNVAAVLLPFLVYYSFAGLLTLDDAEVRQWKWTFFFAWAPWGGPTIARQSIVGLAAIVIVALIAGLRWLLRRSAFAARHPIVGLPAAYLEVLWIILGTALVLSTVDEGLTWAQGRRAWVATVNWLHSDFAGAGPFAGALHAIVSGWLSVWHVIGVALLVPMAALAAGAVVFGLRSDPAPGPAQERRVLPRFVSAAVAVVRRGVAWRIGPAISGLRMLRAAGPAPLLVYCLACVAVTTVPGWLRLLERTIVGPRDLDLVWIPLYRVLGLFNAGVALVLLMSLVAGALGWIAGRAGPATGSAGEQPDVARQLGGDDDPNRDRGGVGRDHEVHLTAPK